jgi:intein/homing endonuclease
MFLKPLIEDLFPIKGRLRIREDNTTRLHFRSKRLASYFLSMGLPLGKKSDASIPARVTGTHSITAFIRGFYHAEGSIYHRYSKRYPYHARKYGNLLVIQFRCKLRTLMLQIHQAVKGLGIIPTRLTEKEGVYTFRITNQTQIKKFLRVVRPRYKKSPRKKGKE